MCSLETAAWVTITPGFVSCMCVPAIGKLADQRHCRSLVWWIGYALHMIGLVAAAAAPTIEVLIAARCITGLASACITPTGFALMVRGVPPARRGQIAAIQEAVMVISPSVGMVAGGWIADHIGWRLLMLAPVPGVALTWVLSLFVLPLDSQQRADDLASQAAEQSNSHKGNGKKESPSVDPHLEDQPFDLLGAFVFAVGMGLMLVGVTKGNDWGWTSDVIAACVGSAVVAFAVLVPVERYYAKDPIFSRCVLHCSTKAARQQSISFRLPVELCLYPTTNFQVVVDGCFSIR